ncbi:MAG: hypothetical protein J6U40_00960, partial [Kiritimatiellae bacterium]|nr:hypothetical protein [Kiritimatiellia bacterium]
CMVIEQRVAFTGPIGTRMDEVMTTAKAGVAIVPGRGGLFRFVLLDNGAWQTNTQVVAEMNRTYLVRMTIDTVARGVLYDLVKEGGTIHLHSGRYPETAHPTALYYRGNVRLRSVKGAVYKANVAAVGDAEYDSVSNALEHAEGTAVTLLHDASYAPGSNGVFRINAAGYTLVLTGGDYGAFAGWAKRHPEVLDGSRSVSARAARISSQLDLDGLVPDAVLDALRQADVRITRAVLSGDGAVDITLKVAGLPVGEAAEMAYVKRIFAILGSPANGEPFQADQVVYLADPLRTADGSVRFRVRPDVSPLPKKFFFRGKIEL